MKSLSCPLWLPVTRTKCANTGDGMAKGLSDKPEGLLGILGGSWWIARLVERVGEL